MALITSVVGYTSFTTTQILAIFDGSSKGKAHLHYEDASGQHRVEAPIEPAVPYGLAKFRVKGLSGGKVRYLVSDENGSAAAAGKLQSSEAKLFRTIAPGPLRVALLSCNDVDNHQFPKEQRTALWKKLGELVKEGQVDLLVHAGDQVYADGDPPGWSKSEGRLAAYRRHYVRTWSHPEVADVLASCPSIMMWDDHEIYDGWGSNDGDGTPAALERFKMAEQAFREFQQPLNPPERLDGGLGWVAKYGDLAVLAVDGRTHRKWSAGTILGKKQLDALELKLNELSKLELKHLFVVIGTPVVFVPLIAAEKLAGAFRLEGLDDIRDGWSSSNNRNECRRFLMSLLNFAGFSPETQVTLMAGDIHVGTLGQIDTDLGFGPKRINPRIYQVTASGIGRPSPSGASAFVLSLITNGGKQELFNSDIRGSLRRIDGSDHAYCLRYRNFAVLDPSDGRGSWDRNGNLWVKYYSEIKGGKTLEHLLPRRH